MTADKAWHILSENPNDLPEPGERVIVCVGKGLVGEAYMKHWDDKELHWFRYWDFPPIETYMSCGVTAWMPMPKPPKKNGTNEEKTKKGTRTGK